MNSSYRFAAGARALGVLLPAILSAADAVPTGPAVGATVPSFRAVDQNGTERTLASLTGSKGLMLVFFRSADW